ncbi:sugar transporter [Roseinatronobacter sp. NSM]|uniref:sugar transporter n=1 Tax=Roseinatronobacter sp. NSM TaxID=3457785 RepID=UPI004035D68F
MDKSVTQGDVSEREATTARLIERTSTHARWRMRHRGLLFSFFLCVLAPVSVTAGYMLFFAQPQYASQSGFVVRQDDSSSASQLLGGLGQMLGSAGVSNSDLLFEFIQSEAIVRRVQNSLDLRAHYAQSWPLDFIFSIPPDVTMETLVNFWRRMVRLDYDKSSGVLMVEVRARDPETAQLVSRLVISESEAMINTLNAAARRDSVANTEADLAAAIEGLRTAREAMVAFQARTQILDPQADIQGRMGVLANLQQQQAQSIVEYDLLLQTSPSSDPRLRQLSRRINVIEDRIARERESFAAQDVTADNTDYPTLLAQYEGLRVDVAFAEEIYRAALTALTQARTNAERQQLFVATFIEPNLPEVATHPRGALLTALTGFFAMMFWAVGMLVYYSLRDRG